MSVKDTMSQMHAEALDEGKQMVEWVVHPNDKEKISTTIRWDGNTAIGTQYLEIPLREDAGQTEGKPSLITS